MKALERHGLRKTPEYRIWAAMKTRCNNPKAKGYQHYGGKGIAVCPEWSNSFRQFYEDMGTRPSPKHSIERDDGTKGYSKNNCRWATAKEQVCNRPGYNRLLTHAGKTQTVAEWAAEIGMSPVTLHCRMKKGWPVDRILTSRAWETADHAKPITFNGKTMNVTAWAKVVGIPKNALVKRLQKGWPVERALTTPLRDTILTRKAA